MQSLTEKLYNNNVLFSYYGFIDSGVLDQVLKITKSKLENNNEPVIVIDRVYDAINDCVENIIEHNFFPDGAILNYKSLLVVSCKDKAYSIDTINVINSEQKESIHEQLAFLNSKSKEELQVLKAETVLKNKNKQLGENTGLGLIDLVLRADNCDYNFKNYDSNFLFNINFKIHSQN